MTDYLWSQDSDDEHWKHDNYTDVMREWEDYDADIENMTFPRFLEIFCGEAVAPSASEFLPECIADSMQEAAVEAVGECADEWLAGSANDIQKEFRGFTDHIFDKYGWQPDFCRVKNIRPVVVQINMADGELSYHALDSAFQ